MSARAQMVDSLYLSSGERLLGDINSLSVGDLNFGTFHMGTVDVEWEHVTRLVSPKSWDIRTADGSHYQGWFRPTQTARHLVIATGADSIEIPMSSIVEFTHLKPGWWLRADGLLFGGVSYQKATELTQWSAGLTFNYFVGYEHFLFKEFSLVTNQKNAADLRIHTGELFWTHGIQRRWSSGVLLGAESNNALALDWRIKSGLVAVNRILQQVPVSEILYGGVQANWERTTSGVRQNTAELVLGSQFLAKGHRRELEADADVTGYLGLTDSGRNRLSAEVNARSKVVGAWKLGIQFRDEYDSRPAPGLDAVNDYQVGTTISYKF